jgi:hypothetical protein
MKAEFSHDIHYESKGFMPATSVTDFPIRDHKVILDALSNSALHKKEEKISCLLPK